MPALVTDPLAFAVMFAICVVLTATAVAANVALELPADTATEAGTDKAALLLLTVTTRPPLGAAELSVNVQVVLPAPVIDWFAQDSDCTPRTLRVFSEDTAFAAIVASPITGTFGLFARSADVAPPDIPEVVLPSIPAPACTAETSRIAAAP